MVKFINESPQHGLIYIFLLEEENLLDFKSLLVGLLFLAGLLMENNHHKP